MKNGGQMHGVRTESGAINQMSLLEIQYANFSVRAYEAYSFARRPFHKLLGGLNSGWQALRSQMPKRVKNASVVRGKC